MANRTIGRRVGFPIQLGDRNQIVLVSDDTAIRQSLRIIIFTIPGERVMRPTFGCEIHSLVFAPANEETAALAERFVREAVERWEPRVTLTDVTVTPGATEYGELNIALEYEVKATHDPRSMVFPYYLLPR
jgi:phage baseplate assembly protein W